MFDLAALPTTAALSIVDTQKKIDNYHATEHLRGVLLLEMYQGNAHCVLGYSSFAEFASVELDMDLAVVSLPKSILRAFWEKHLGPLRCVEFDLITGYFSEIPTEEMLAVARRIYAEYKEAKSRLGPADDTYKKGYPGRERKILRDLCVDAVYPVKAQEQIAEVVPSVSKQRPLIAAPPQDASLPALTPEGLNWLVWIFGANTPGPHAAFRFEAWARQFKDSCPQSARIEYREPF